MKSIVIKISAFVLFTSLVSCETDFVNPNSPTNDQILTSREGLFGLSTGILQLYSTQGLRFVLESPALTTREVAANITLVNYLELEDGGANLINTNSLLSPLWAVMLRVNQMCSSIISNVGSVSLEEETANSLMANAMFFKAMSIGNLAQNFEQVVTTPSTDNNASFVPRQEGFAEAISLLEDAAELIGTSGVSQDFDDAVLLGNIDLPSAIQAYLARYYLFAGNYADAISAAGRVDKLIKSTFNYDGTQNNNPVWGSGLFHTLPRDDFGIERDFSGDGRVAFHTVVRDTTSRINKLDVELFSGTGFFGTSTSAIPVYLPGEMQLIIAEARVRQASPDLTAAIAAVNAVRTKTDDVFGLNAGLDPYSGPETEEDILEEIYANRRAELFLTGMSLEDSRRFNIPEPSGNSEVYTEPRNRNFYPYPQRERSNNPNTPPDPSI
ncbi:MAG: RagB/SusD family nutrient uptake outer membrane protein [Ekhidna sp.]|nr:RagB/SusD family nutrient uptake outer membrane protein [Ekhidna sp.]